VAKQVGEKLSLDGHTQLRCPGEISLDGFARNMVLGEKYLLVGSELGLPNLNPPLEGPELTILVDPWAISLQIFEKAFGLQLRGLRQTFCDSRPVFRERCYRSAKVGHSCSPEVGQARCVIS